MRVGIDYRPARLQRAGIARYTRELVSALPASALDLELALFAVAWHRPRPVLASPPDCKRVSLAAARFPGRLVDALGAWTPLSVETWTGAVDLFHFTDYVAPPVARDRPTVFTLHDTSYLRPERFHPAANASRLAAVAERLIRRARVVLAVSESTRRDALSHYDLAEERVVVSPLGVEERFFAVERAPREDPPRVLCFGTLEPRKNVERLLRAFELLLESGREARLVLVGRRGWMDDEIFRLLERPRLAAAVDYEGEIDDARLFAHLREATIVAYPSLWEGFGLPVLEGMAAGVPVLTSDRGSLAEVAGDAALLVDPGSVGAIHDGLERLWDDAALRGDLEARGRARARAYPWSRCAAATLRAYRLALELA